METVRKMDTKANMNSRSDLPTAKAEDYRRSLQEELTKPALKPDRRLEIEEDLKLLDGARFVELNGVVHHYFEQGPPWRTDNICTRLGLFELVVAQQRKNFGS